MSLNGLDDPKVLQAYEASAEPGAWFILKYATRDEVELLETGTGGLPELRKAVEDYDETSPLYGFLRYRRRVVIVRYLPEGCSRLIQARVAVHFNAVCERFSPHDTTLEITTADELRDSKLSAACSLHAASASNASSSSSNRRRRLNEIAEEDEDELQQRAPKRQSMTLNNEELASDATPASSEPAVTLNSDLATSPDESKFSAASTSDIPQFVGADPTSPTSTEESSRRMSTQSGRQESLNYAYYPYSKPKVKLGPRPSLDVSARPQTAGNFRPVSSIPAGLKMFGTKGTKKPGSTKSRDSEGLPSPTDDTSLPSSVPASEDAQRAYFEVARPSTSSGVTLAPKSPSAMSSTTIKQGMTPEKARLMKAKKMREKKKAQAAQPPVPAIPAFAEQSQPSNDEAPPASAPEEADKSLSEEAEEQQPTPDAEKRVTMIKTDSAIAIEATSGATAASTDEASVLTQTDSRPTSPVVASSDVEQSTQASSISDLTDETVEAKAAEIKDDKEVEKATEDTPEVEDVAKEDPATAPDNSREPERPHEIDTVTDPSDQTQTESTSLEQPVEQPQGHIAHELPAETSEPQAQGTSDEIVADTVAPEAPEPAMIAPVSRFSAKNNPLAADTAALDVAGEVNNYNDGEGTPAAASADSETAAPATPLTRQYSVSKRDLRKATQAAASPSAVLEGPTVFIDESAIVEEDAAVQSTDDHSDAETISADTKTKRKPAVDPIRTDLPSRPVSRTETDFADDESLLNELQSATVEEAKPMLVAKTPVTPVFPSPFSADTPPPQNAAVAQPPRGGHMVRTVSNPVRGSLVAPPSDVSQSSARSMSGGAAYLHKITQQQQAGANLAKKTNMGSSISKRIKALEMLSVEPKETAKPAVPGRERPSSTFFSVKKGRTPSRSPSVMERASSFNIKPATPPAAQSREVSPEAEKQLSRRQRERSGSVASRLSMFEPPAGAPGSGQHSPHNSPRGRPESISVTAKIIRDPETSLDAPKDPSQFGHLDLKQSPLVVDHQRAEPAPPSGPAEAMAALLGNRETIQERRISRESIRSQSHDRGKGSTSRRSSLSVVKDFIKERRRSITSQNNDPLATPTLTSSGSKSPSRPPSVHQSSSISHRLSFSSHRSSLSKDRDMMTSPVLPETPSFDISGDEVKSLSSEKRRSRAGRLMRRLSNLGSRGKISTPAGLAATVTEEEIIPEQPPPRPATTATSTAPPIVSYMGDVNVQFPDNLLWKRRNLCLDAAGYILLSVSAQQQTTRAGAVQGTKRYHLSDFRRPYAPDVEVQELPNSVVLDFMEGSGLQFACEDRVGQANVLHILQDAHAKHALMFQM
ncbi:hypothetical protein CC79DRAFT_1369674 [Sarocladium strictum]